MRLRNRFALRVAIATICAHSIFSFFGGGFVSADSASGNNVTIEDETVDGSIFAGYSDSEDASNNTLTITNVTAEDANQVDAGYTYGGNSSNNTINITNLTSSAFVHGGYSLVTGGNANYNLVNFYSGTAYEVHGGHSSYGDAIGNTVNFYDGTVTNIGAGYSDLGNVYNNTLNIYGGTINGTAYGGITSYGGTGGDATGNIINIYGGTFNGDIYGGWAPDGSATDSEMNLHGSPDLTNATLYAGRSSSSGTSSGNSLNIYTKNLTAQNVSGFENLNIYLPENISSGDSILTLTSSSGTNLTDTSVHIGQQLGTTIAEGSQINLISNTNGGLTVSDIDFDNTIYEGITLQYGASLDVQDNSLVLNVGSLQGVNQNTRIVPTSYMSIPSIVKTSINRGNNSFNDITNKDIDSLEFELENEIRPFASMSIENVRTKLGNGSYLDTKNRGIDIGWSKAFNTDHGLVVVAPIFDYSDGSYDAHLPNGVYGTGDSSYFSGGVITRIVRNSGMYYEGSLRYGRAESDFYADKFPTGSTSTAFVTYDVGTPVISGHVHLGKFFGFGRRNKIQVYGQYAHAYQKGTDTHLSTGEHYIFDSLNLGTAKAGVRMISTPRDNSNFYTGLAIQYDLGNDAVAHYREYSTPSSDSSGSTGIIECGWQYRPTQRSPWALDLNAMGMAGHEKGFSFQAKIKKAF